MKHCKLKSSAALLYVALGVAIVIVFINITM
jgi:hypothetical protein